MAVDQLRNLNFYREMLSTSNNYTNNTNNIVNPMLNHIIVNNNLMMYSNNSNVTNSLPVNGDPQLLLPFYNLNDVGKLPPPVKDDSGVTFNNSLPAATSSRKRAREQTVLSPEMIGVPSLLASNAGCGNIVGKEFEWSDFSFLGQDLSPQIMQQELELDRLVSHHMGKMKVEMEEGQKQQYRRMMASMEDRISKKLREKDEEISKLVKINMELEEKVKSVYLQSQIWRDVAHTNEATANALRSNLEQVLLQNDAVRESADDAVSCCGSSGGYEEDEELRVENDWVYRGGKKEGGKRCKKCGEGESRVLVLPCRHLCLCGVCGPRVNACPICETVKDASIHVNFS